MKAVAIICLLSLSMCLTRAAEPITEKPAIQPPAQTPTEKAVPAPVKPDDKPQNATQPAADSKQTEISIVTTSTEASNKPVTQAAGPINPDNGTKADNKTVVPKDKTTVPPKNDTTEKPAPTNETKPAEGSGKTSTVHPTPAKPTEAPTATDVPNVQSRGFDGASFVGGIILTLGLLAIGFMGFKYYKNQTERNYHTL